MVESLVLLICGFLAGGLGGLLGIGGGVVLMPVLRFGVGLSPPSAAGTCILAIFFTTLGGSYRHYRLGHVHLRSLVPLILSGATACAVFCLWFPTLAARGRYIDLGIGVVFFLIAMRMILEAYVGVAPFRSDWSGDNRIGGTLTQKMTVGAAGGVLPGLLGIGTGGVLVPAFSFLMRTPIKTAMGASLCCFCTNALISSAFKVSQGFADLGIALPLCGGTLVGANLGALLNKRYSSAAVKLLFGLVFCFVSTKFLLSYLEVTI